MPPRIALFMSRRGNSSSFEILTFSQESWRKGRKNLNWVKSVSRVPQRPFRFSYPHFLASHGWKGYATARRLASPRKIGASRPGESCICFPLCIIFPRRPPTIFPLTIPAVYIFHLLSLACNGMSPDETVSCLIDRRWDDFYVPSANDICAALAFNKKEKKEKKLDNKINKTFDSL